jgi:hypothetical protein
LGPLSFVIFGRRRRETKRDARIAGLRYSHCG